MFDLLDWFTNAQPPVQAAAVSASTVLLAATINSISSIWIKRWEISHKKKELILTNRHKELEFIILSLRSLVTTFRDPFTEKIKDIITAIGLDSMLDLYTVLYLEPESTRKREILMERTKAILQAGITVAENLSSQRRVLKDLQAKIFMYFEPTTEFTMKIQHLNDLAEKIVLKNQPLITEITQEYIKGLIAASESIETFKDIGKMTEAPNQKAMDFYKSPEYVQLIDEFESSLQQLLSMLRKELELKPRKRSWLKR